MSMASARYELRQVDAYEEASRRIRARIADLQERLRDEPSDPRLRYRLARETGALGDVEGRIDELLGATNDNIVGAWGTSQDLAAAHIDAETRALFRQLILDEDALSVGHVADFAKLDTDAIELGLGTAIADNRTLMVETRQAILREVQAGFAAGQNLRQVAAGVDAILGDSRARAEMITRWAMVKGYNLSRQANLAVTARTVPGLRKQWQAQPDERTCPHCLAQHGIVVEVNESFDPNMTYASTPVRPLDGFLLTPPLHPRCRCLIVAWHEAWRPYTTIPPDHQHYQARRRAMFQGWPRATYVGIGPSNVFSIPIWGELALIEAATPDELLLLHAAKLLRELEGIAVERAGEFLMDTLDALEVIRELHERGFETEYHFARGRIVVTVRQPVDADEVPGPLRNPPATQTSSSLRAVPDERWEAIKSGVMGCAATQGQLSLSAPPELPQLPPPL